MDDSTNTKTKYEDEVERSRLAIERATVSYLCSQLRLRLQYAKLKVDNGWQRQNLDEVENLYFTRQSDTARISLAPPPVPPYAASTSTARISAEISRDSPSSSLMRGPPASEAGPSRVSTSHPYTRPPAVPRKQRQAKPTNSKASPRQPRAPKGKPRSTTSTQSHTPFSAAPSTLRTTLSTLPFPDEASHPPLNYILYPCHPAVDPYYSSAHYLSNAYVSSSPFPINMPPTRAESPPPPGSGKLGRSLTYDSFWSSHSRLPSQPLNPPPLMPEPLALPRDHASED